MFQKETKILEKNHGESESFSFFFDSLPNLPLYSAFLFCSLSLFFKKRGKGTNQPFLSSRKGIAERKERPEQWNKNTGFSLEKVYNFMANSSKKGEKGRERQGISSPQQRAKVTSFVFPAHINN